MDRWVTFDCYGTLTNWTQGMLGILERVAGDRAPALLGSYYRLEPPVAARTPHLPYREVLAETLRQAAAEQRIDLDPGRESVLSDNWEELGPYGDTAHELARLQDAGWKIAVLTNCDDDLFALSAAQLGVELDLAITAEQVKSYKPKMAHFTEFASRTGATRENWVHVGNSWMADIVAASRMGVGRVWIDRDHSGHDETLAHEWQHDLKDLVDLVGRAQAAANE